MNQNTRMIVELSDGVRTSTEIAALVGLSARYVRKVMFRLDLPRRKEGAQPGGYNHQFVSGRRIDFDGYVLVTAPSSHPYARDRTGRKTKLMYEHRLVMERKLGRYLLPTEVVDHIDGLTLHNAPENLRLFASNPDHLRETLTGHVPAWSEAGYQRMKTTRLLRKGLPRVDTYRQNKALGDVRLRQILRAALALGIDSPYLLGSHHHLEKAQIDVSSRSKIEHALAALSLKSQQDHAPSQSLCLEQHTPQAPSDQ